MAGFGVALKPINLLWGFVGVTLGTFIGVLPGVGPALTVAMLLPLTAKLDPTGALIMFAGIYYGAMFGGSTTTILLNTPGESASIATALEGNRMAKAGRAGPGARDLGDRLLRRRLDRHGAAHAARALGGGTRAQVRARGVLLADGVRLHHGVRGAGRLDRARAHEPVHRPFLRPDRHRQPDRAAALRLRRRRTARRRGRGGARRRPLRGGRGAVRRRLPEPPRGDHREGPGLDHDVDGGLEALLAGLAARHRDRFSLRHHSGRRRRDPDLPFLHGGEEALEASGGVRPWRHRGRRRAGSGEQRLRHRRPGAAADAGHPDLGDRRDPAGRVPELRPAAGAAAFPGAVGPRLGPDRESLCRQRDPADPQPAAHRHLGEGADDPEGHPLRGHPGLRHAGRLQPAPVLGGSPHPVRVRPARLCHAALGHPGRPGGDRPDPRAAGRDAIPPRAFHQPGRRERVLHAADLGRLPRRDRGAGDRALGGAAVAGRCLHGAEVRARRHSST